MGGRPFLGLSRRWPHQPRRQQAGPPHPDPAYSRTGTFRATPRTDGWWDTGLLTTEGSEEAFTVRTGDRLEVRVCLPTGLGAW